MNTKYIWLLVILLGFTACNDIEDILADNNIETPEEVVLPALTAGSANFSTFVAVGNSLTAGYTDGALFKIGQENSMSNILAQKFAMAGGGAFTQPLTNDNIGGLLLLGDPVANARLFFDGAGPAVLPAAPTTEISSIAPGPYNNMSVPGAKSFHLLANGYGNIQGLPSLANPYYVRMASSPTASMLEDAMAQSPTFFLLWIGANDVLGYATTGGDGSNAITPQGTFDFAYSTLVTSLTAGGAGGVVANIPDVTSIPHFTTVPHNPLDPTNPAFGPQIPTLNGIFGQINQVFAFLESQGIPNATDRQIVFSETAASAVVVKDESLMDLSTQIANVLMASPTFPAFVQSFGLPAAAAPQVAGLLGLVYGQARQATEDDLLVLPSSSVIGTLNTDFAAFLGSQGLPPALAGQFSVEGISLPLEDKWVLLPSEQAEIKTATDAINATISSVASQAGLAFVDANGLMNELADTGLWYGDYKVTAKLVTGGVFSLDGVHPTARGYAFLANQFMKAIDAKYGSNFVEAGAMTNGGDYPTNYNPALQ